MRRAHLVSRRTWGATLLELFTHWGVGTMLTADPVERLREATIEDIGGVLALLEPLEADGTLVKRSRELIEAEIGISSCSSTTARFSAARRCIPTRTRRARSSPVSR